MQRPLILIISIICVIVVGLFALNLWQGSQAPLVGISADATIIDLRGKGLTALPAEIGQYTNARQLLLDDNSLTGALPAEIGRLTKLEVLSASHNMLTGIPAEIGKLQSLQALDLSYNQIDTYPQELGDLQQSIVLNLQGNAFSEGRILELQGLMPNAEIVF